MNLRDLKYIIAVADTKHFGRAAQRCFVSQPTLSGQIKKLEEHLGVAIFERTNRSVEITEVGEGILRHARIVLEQVDVMEQLAQSFKDPLAGPLRVGAIPTLSPYLLPLILSPLRAQFPQMHLVLSEEMTEILLRRLANHEIDAAILATPVNESDFATLPLFDEPFWLAHPRNHPLYEKEKITRKDLESVDLLLLSEGHCLADQAMEICNMDHRNNKGELADLRAASLETLLQLVGAGFGCTLVPALAMRGSWTTDSGIIARPLAVKDAYRRIQMVYRRSFPRKAALDALASVIWQRLPNTVKPIGKKP